MNELITDHDHPKTGVVRGSGLSPHFVYETSYLQEVSPRKSSVQPAINKQPLACIMNFGNHDENPLKLHI